MVTITIVIQAISEFSEKINTLSRWCVFAFNLRLIIFLTIIYSSYFLTLSSEY